MNNIQKFKILNENQFSHIKGNSSSDELFPLEKNNICIKALNSTKQIQKSNETEKQNITSKNKSEKNRKLIPTLLKEKQKDKLLFGNYIGIENPKKCGNVFCFYYIKKYPLFLQQCQSKPCFVTSLPPTHRYCLLRNRSSLLSRNAGFDCTLL